MASNLTANEPDSSEELPGLTTTLATLACPRMAPRSERWEITLQVTPGELSARRPHTHGLTRTVVFLEQLHGLRDAPRARRMT